MYADHDQVQTLPTQVPPRCFGEEVCIASVFCGDECTAAVSTRGDFFLWGAKRRHVLGHRHRQELGSVGGMWKQRASMPTQIFMHGPVGRGARLALQHELAFAMVVHARLGRGSVFFGYGASYPSICDECYPESRHSWHARRRLLAQQQRQRHPRHHSRQSQQPTDELEINNKLYYRSGGKREWTQKYEISVPKPEAVLGRGRLGVEPIQENQPPRDCLLCAAPLVRADDPSTSLTLDFKLKHEDTGNAYTIKHVSRIGVAGIRSRELVVNNTIEMPVRIQNNGPPHDRGTFLQIDPTREFMRLKRTMPNSCKWISHTRLRQKFVQFLFNSIHDITHSILQRPQEERKEWHTALYVAVGAVPAVEALQKSEENFVGSVLRASAADAPNVPHTLTAARLRQGVDMTRERATCMVRAACEDAGRRVLEFTEVLNPPSAASEDSAWRRAESQLDVETGSQFARGRAGMVLVANWLLTSRVKLRGINRILNRCKIRRMYTR